MKKITILTLYPELFTPFFSTGVIGQALRGPLQSQVHIEVRQLRDFALDKHHNVDDYPYGGGAGMVLRADVLKNALTSVTGFEAYDDLKKNCHVVFPAPRGLVWHQYQAQQFCQDHFLSHQHLIFICGRFEGVDERFLTKYVDQFISVGDFILTGGELATQIILDTALRFFPSVLGNDQSTHEESFSPFFQGGLEPAHYTRPSEFEGMGVPAVLTSGHHALINQYRLNQGQELTQKWRPDLL